MGGGLLRRKGFFAEVHEFKGFVKTREEVMDDRIYLRSGAAVLCAYTLYASRCTRAHAPNTYADVTYGATSRAFFGSSVMKFSWGIPPRQ